MIQGYQNLQVYQRAYDLALKVHKATAGYPQFEKYELGGQVRRAAVSIVLNIVEGYGRKDSAAEFKHFLRNALGSCNETRVLLQMAKDLGYFEASEYEQIQTDYEILSKQIYRLKEKWS